MIKSCENCRHERLVLGKFPCTICDMYRDRWEAEGDIKVTENKKINGVAEEEMTTNSQGGRQSKLDYRFDLIDTKAIFALANVLHTGEVRYGKDNWRKIDTESHLNHALSHIYAYLAGDTQDSHMGHAFCRLMMAIGVEKE